MQEASRRFSVPEPWIRAVIRQESGGHEYLDGQPVTSSAGAMGLMQLMPETYAEMQERFSLGSDPYEPHDNIMAGTGYISILYAKYGAPAFLAAYNAGPQRLEDYLYNGRDLPNETTNYVASITPNLGTQIAMTGPLAAYASPEQLGGASSGPLPDNTIQLADARDTAARSEPEAVEQAWAGRRIVSVPSDTMPPDDSADLPAQAPTPAPLATLPGTTLPGGAHVLAVSYQPRNYDAAPGRWEVQVGAFANPDQARSAAMAARRAGPLASAAIDIQPTVAHGARFWRARLAGISREDAGRACASLERAGTACMAVPPGF